MSVEVKLTFPHIEAAAAFLTRGWNVEAKTEDAAITAEPAATKATCTPKPAKTEELAASPSTADPTPAAAPAPSPVSAAPAPTVAAPSDELPYPPLAERITKALAASNAKAPDNRAALKGFFAELATEYGTPVKTGRDVKAVDRPRLAAVLDKTEAAVEDSMS